jgi:Flp pilus assembly pilin Flp
MNLLNASIARFVRQTEGQDLLEYALLAGLIAIVAVATVTQVGQKITTILWNPIAASI